jgi:Family of unknown function (DUF5677)
MSQHPDPSVAEDAEPNRDPSAELIRLSAAVDVILEAVEKAAQPTTQHVGRDVNDALLGAAYGRAYRCMRSIRELAARGEADDAAIIARALVSLVARSLYLVAPDDATERRARFERALLTWADAMLRASDDLEAAGFEHDGDRDRVARIVATAKRRGIPKLPNDHDILVGLGLRSYYARIYRLASEVVHYSVGSALDGFVEYPRSGVIGGRSR